MELINAKNYWISWEESLLLLYKKNLLNCFWGPIWDPGAPIRGNPGKWIHSLVKISSTSQRIAQQLTTALSTKLYNHYQNTNTNIYIYIYVCVCVYMYIYTYIINNKVIKFSALRGL